MVHLGIVGEHVPVKPCTKFDAEYIFGNSFGIFHIYFVLVIA